MRLPTKFANRNVPLNMSPVFDMVFQLFIYFLCTASFAASERVLPATGPKTAVRASPLDVQELEVIRIGLRQDTDELRLELNGTSVAGLADLRDRLQPIVALADLPAVLEISPEVEIAHVVAAYDTCHVAGIREIQFAAPNR